MPTHSTHNSSRSSQPPLEQVLGLVKARLPPDQQATLADFAGQYFGQVDPDDIAEREVGDLYGAVLSHWQFARRREPGAARVRVFNPTQAEHGWQSTHTVVEIVNDDMPFLVDSVTMEVNRHGLRLHLLVHPIVALQRNAEGLAQGLGGDVRESFIHVEVDRIPEPERLQALAADLQRVLGDVRAAVGDWQAMREKLLAIVDQLERQPPPLPVDERAEGLAFLRWLADNHFTFLGHRSHQLTTVDGEDRISVVVGSNLGILREQAALDATSAYQALPPEVRAYARRPELMVVTKSTARSTVHRPGYLDYVAVKRFDAQGGVCGEDRFLGLFTSTAYSANPAEIPLLRRKVADVVARAGLTPGSHAGKALINILDTYPRDELFQTDTDELLHTATGILHLGERQRFRLFVRRDPFERFLVCLIYAPRENYSTELRQKWQAILLKAFNGLGSEFNVSLSESALARIQITVRTEPGRIAEFDVREIEAQLVAAARRWDDDLRAALIEASGEARGIALMRRFGGAFPAGYREEFSARAAVPDIALMAELNAEQPVAMSLYRPLEAPPGTLRFKLFHHGRPLTLSVSLPMLEHMGMRVLDEHPFKVQPQDGAPIWIHDFGLQLAEALQPAVGDELEVDSLHAIFEEAFAAVLRGEVENDGFNRLVVAARLPARQVVVLRAYARYLRQIGFALSQAFVEATLVAHADITRLLTALFLQRFDPAGGPQADSAAAVTVQAIEAALEQVDNLSEDRVLRQLLGLIQATLRTNFWRTDGAGRPRSFLSFKFDCARVPGLPAPKPLAEIFVYSPRFEGVHLRGGRVARGGLRWSDRPEDFRTEVLGLVKAQMVKNTVIVPVGSKGGFVLKRSPPPSDREAFMKEGVACYQDYLRGLLDLTDNRRAGQVLPPPQLRRHDGDDPYLVVAADKGTATFSDHANAISAEYGHWLGDAFASGGSIGYDHKAMGITARGAWESVKRHFRELGHDTQSQPFSVVGIGDMSGDVFGNGMLLSRHIRLLAAFDHRHVFLDPNPDTARSFAERERLFRLPRSSWADYDASLISPGGGVYPRSAKAITLTPEVRAALGLAAESLAPTELIHLLLQAPVDLVYNGGIGTYVKAADETHAEVGDRANDGLRVNGAQLRCKVFAEGGNLGCTQRGRIEYALAGGRINTDAIDNSAGVDTSDHEVNIKILLGLAVTEGELTDKQRNGLLPAMTDEVAALVLRDNIFQTQVLSLMSRVAPQLLDAQTRFMQFLEKAGRLNRALEYLPDDEAIAERRQRGIGLTRPELAVVLAYAKMWLYDELLNSPLPDDPWVATALERYFPGTLRERFGRWMPLHPLKREIIATHVTNSALNRVGATFVHRLCETTGARAHEIVRAYLISREVFGVVPLWEAIEALGTTVDEAHQAQMRIDLTLHLERATKWFLRSRRLTDPVADSISHFAPAVQALAERLPALLEPEARAEDAAAIGRLQAQGVPEATASAVVRLQALVATLDIAEVASQARQPVEAVAAVYFELSSRLGVPWLRECIAALPADRHWRLLARGALADDLASLQRTITGAVFAEAAAGTDPAALVPAWAAQNQRALERAGQLMAELRAGPAPDVAMLSVALRELRGLG